MIPTGYRIDLSDARGARYDSWPTKGAAVAALKELQERGLHVGTNITDYPAQSAFGSFWVLGRPDNLAEMTLLMREDGSWDRGRLWDSYTVSRWEYLPLPSGPVPATFTHVTRTVLDPTRKERYKSKSNGSCGRWVQPDESIALCTCGWKAYGTDRAEARWRAVQHSEQVAS